MKLETKDNIVTLVLLDGGTVEAELNSLKQISMFRYNLTDFVRNWRFEHSEECLSESLGDKLNRKISYFTGAKGLFKIGIVGKSGQVGLWHYNIDEYCANTNKVNDKVEKINVDTIGRLTSIQEVRTISGKTTTVDKLRIDYSTNPATWYYHDEKVQNLPKGNKVELGAMREENFNYKLDDTNTTTKGWYNGNNLLYLEMHGSKVNCWNLMNKIYINGSNGTLVPIDIVELTPPMAPALSRKSSLTSRERREIVEEFNGKDSKEITQAAPKEIKEAPKEIKEAPKEIKEAPKEITQAAPKEITQAAPKEITQVVPKEAPKEITQVVPKEAPKEITQVVPKEVAPIAIAPTRTVEKAATAPTVTANQSSSETAGQSLYERAVKQRQKAKETRSVLPPSKSSETVSNRKAASQVPKSSEPSFEDIKIPKHRSLPEIMSEISTGDLIIIGLAMTIIVASLYFSGIIGKRFLIISGLMLAALVLFRHYITPEQIFNFFKY